MTEDRLDWHLWNWRRWMGLRKVVMPPGAPRKASGGIGRSHRSDIPTMTRAADNRCAAAVDALIDDLPPRHRAAIYHVELAAVFRVRDTRTGEERQEHQENIDWLYAKAREHIAYGLDKRGIP